MSFTYLFSWENQYLIAWCSTFCVFNAEIYIYRIISKFFQRWDYIDILYIALAPKSKDVHIFFLTKFEYFFLLVFVSKFLLSEK